MSAIRAFGCLLLLGASGFVVADDNVDQKLAAILERPDVQSAMAEIEAMQPALIDDLIELTEIPAPPFGEQKRGERFAEMLREAGLSDVSIDEEGNVIGRRPGTSGERVVAVTAHLDTVFPIETDVTVRVEGDTYYAPGIGDNTRGLVSALAILRSLQSNNIQTEADVLFIGNVGEEGLGDLRGVKHLFREDGPQIDSMIAIDGGRTNRIVRGGVGSHRYRVTFKGPGGHSWGAFGRANPHHALGRATAHFVTDAKAVIADDEKTTYNVGRTGGGTSVNSIPFESWMEIDMRSGSQAKLDEIDAVLQQAVEKGLQEENAARLDGPELTVDVKRIGTRPAARSDVNAMLVEYASASMRALDIEPDLSISSTDANHPISIGVPAITLSRGGSGKNAHAPAESWTDVDAHLASQITLLTVLLDAKVSDKRVVGDMRIAVASFAMETCTFCPRATDIEHFEFYGQPFTGEDVLDTGSDVRAFTRAVREYQGVEVIGVYAVRDPVGGSMGSWVTERAFDKFAGEIVERLAAIEDLDGVYLPLHGAMAVDGIARPEAELVRRIKAALGDIPVAVTYDLHANEDAEIAKQADIVLVVKRFPHYDFALMGERAARLLVRTIRGDYDPVLVVQRPNIAFATVYGGTHQGVPRDMMERARRWENRRTDVYVSVAMGFPFADVPDVGMSVLVQTNGNEALATEIAADMTRYIQSRRDEFEYDIPKLQSGVDEGLAALDAGAGPLVLANLSDRLGDATHIMGELIKRHRSNFVVATIADAAAIETIKRSYAVGDALSIDIGGHTSDLAGEPVTIAGTVAFIGGYEIGGSVESDLVALRFGENNWVLLTPDRYQVTTRSILDHAGVPVDEMDIFVVKSRNHFRRGFMETGLAKTAVVIDAPGHGPADLGQLDFKNLPKDTWSRFLSSDR